MAQVRAEGLAHCCIETAKRTAGHEGDQLRCGYCGEHLVFRKGAWERNKE